MNVTVIGPNLRDQSKGDFHVHRAGCADIARRYKGENQSDLDVASRDAVVADWFDFLDDPNEARDEFHFAPCLDDLKENA
jgi:acyl-CoA-binding protein